MRFGRRFSPAQLLRRADEARDRGDWRPAATAYARYLEGAPDDAAIHVQHGHALKESGSAAEATRAYQRSLDLDPENADSWLQLGHVLKLQGRADDAAAAYRRALTIDAALEMAAEELVSLGGTDELPADRRSYDWGEARIADVSGDITRLAEQIGRWQRQGPYGPASWDLFRQHFPLRPPPSEVIRHVGVWLEARTATPAELRATLESVQDQSHVDWSVRVDASPALAGHSVAGSTLSGGRLTFEPGEAPDGALCLSLSAGTVLHQHALAWFAFATDRHDRPFATCDWDHARAFWRDGLIHSRPRLNGVHDDLRVLQADEPPPVLLWTSDAPERALDGEGRRAILLGRPAGAAVLHLPLPLASVLLPAQLARNAPGDGQIWRGHGDQDGVSAPPDALADTTLGPMRLIRAAGDRRLAVPANPAGAGPLLVLIQTRDQADLLARAVDSLKSRAADPTAVRIHIADNRSRLDETRALLDSLVASGAATVERCDAPFNWSLTNNRLADMCPGHDLVFANNDIEMLTSGWDTVVNGFLAADAVGALGARLLYDDGSVQHAGVVFVGRPLPIRHEGVGARPADGGPGDRWWHTRSVGAVTGAFLCTRRDTFDAIGGFDGDRLPISYSDVDYCLRVREGGRHVVYTPAIEALHHESKTRGRNIGAADVAWDQAELTALHERWGDVLFEDPGVSPFFAPGDRPFDGYREPPRRELLRWLDRAAGPKPWMVRRAGHAD